MLANWQHLSIHFVHRQHDAGVYACKEVYINLKIALKTIEGVSIQM